MEDGSSRRIEMLEQKVEMLAKQLREHDQLIQSMTLNPLRADSVESLLAENAEPGEERRIAGTPPQWHPAPRVFHQKVLDDLMRIVRDESGVIVSEHNVVQKLQEIIAAKHNAENQLSSAAATVKKMQSLFDEMAAGTVKEKGYAGAK